MNKICLKPFGQMFVHPMKRRGKNTIQNKRTNEKNFSKFGKLIRKRITWYLRVPVGRRSVGDGARHYMQNDTDPTT